MSKVFFIGTRHPEYPDTVFPEGSVVIDPFRYIPDQPGVTVRRLGQNRPALISVLLPSRGRPDALLAMVNSLSATAAHRRRIEVIVYLDEDDPALSDYWKLIFNDTVAVHYHVEPRRLLSECWNFAASKANGEILMHGGDDVQFATPGWDQQVRDAFAASQDKILLVQGDDLSPNRETLATHGFLHRRWVETVGYFLPPLFSCDWNDVWITEVADMLGRRVRLPFVTEHLHHSFGKREHDLTDAEREARGREDDVVSLYKRTAKDRVSDAAKLRAVMA